jgi:alkylated DNA repair dioxygenase AlkB
LKAVKARQPSLFAEDALPDGMRYCEQIISVDRERSLAAFIAALPLKSFEFVGGFQGNRRVLSFGWRYDFNDRQLHKAADMPSELLELRAHAAAFARMAPEIFEHVLVTEYAPGAGIGWHRDRAAFGEVIGVSLLAPCNFRLRRKRGEGWERTSLHAQPRSAYLLSGASRTEWEHSIPPLDRLRCSVTFRSFRTAGRRGEDAGTRGVTAGKVLGGHGSGIG